MNRGTATCPVCPATTAAAAGTFPEIKIKQHAATISHQRLQEAWVKRKRANAANSHRTTVSAKVSSPLSSPQEAINAEGISITCTHTSVLTTNLDIHPIEEAYSPPSTEDHPHTDEQFQYKPTTPSVQYSINQPSDPLAESLARALDGVETGICGDEIPLPDDEDCFEKSDPFFCGK